MTTNVTRSLNYPLKVRLPNGDEVALVDIERQPLYSTAYILSGAQDALLQLFNYARADKVTVSSNIPATVAPDATWEHTNMAEASEADATEALFIYSLQFEVIQTAADAAVPATTVDNPGGAYNAGIPRAGLLGPLMHQLVARLDIELKKYGQAGFGWFATGFGPKVFSDGAAAPVTFAANGHQEREAVEQFIPPLSVRGTNKFTVELLNDGGRPLNFYDDTGAVDTTAVAKIRGYLHGLHKRATA